MEAVLIIVFAYLFAIGVYVLSRHRFFNESDSHLQQRLAGYADPSDGEYLERMPNDVSENVALGVRRILVDVGGVEADEVWPETTLVDLLE